MAALNHGRRRFHKEEIHMHGYANGDMRGACSGVAGGIVARSEASLQARAAPTSVDPHALSTLFQAADSNMLLAHSLADRLQKAMDFICGQEPNTKAESMGGQEVTSAALDMLNEKQRLTWLALDRLDTQVRRLERVVG